MDLRFDALGLCDDLRRAAEELGWSEVARVDSRVAGPKGNREVFLLLDAASR